MSENTVKGQKPINAAGSEYNAMQFVIKQAIRGQVHTAIPVRVQAVNGLFVDVLPLVSSVDGYGESVEPTTLFHLPVFRYHAGVAAVIVDPVPGDIGLAVFAQSDSSNVNTNTDTPQQPGSFRRYSMSDGFFFNGFHKADPSVYIEVTQDGVVNIEAATVNISGNVNIGGDATIGGISFAGHVHGGIQPGGSDTSTPH
jgi:hypothetical protein